MANKTFPQFTKTIVQLPIPSATMTKAEYKAKYGIDLNAIDFPKIIILVDGKDKYPVDEIRVVSTTTEIYAGGKILSIGSTNVSVTSDAYSVANAKPIYYHPIAVWGKNSGTRESDAFSLVIINNDPTPFASLASIISWARENEIQTLSPLTGVVSNSDKTKQLVIAWVDIGEAAILFRGQYTGEYGYLPYVTIADASFDQYNISDGVNKIN